MSGRETGRYDAVVVGARVAGASTALLLARSGLEVLLLDRGELGSDVLSTHAIMRGGVLQLHRWGLLDDLVAAGTPPIRRTTFHYGADEVTVEINERDGVDALYAPRRTVLDPLLVEAARTAGVEVRHEARVTGLIESDGRVAGVEFVDADGGDHEVRASITVGADGMRSLVARTVDADRYWQGEHASGFVYGYFPDPGTDGYHWYYGSGVTAGMIPTNHDEVLVWGGRRGTGSWPSSEATSAPR